MRLLLVAFAFAVAVQLACLSSTAVVCEDGRFCPAGTICDEKHDACALPEQRDACTSLDDGDFCEAGDLDGLCDQGFCISGCGDGVPNAAEECDDGNLQSRDGCSSHCLLESARWSAEIAVDRWAPRGYHAAAFETAPNRNRLVVFGGSTDLAGFDDAMWERTQLGMQVQWRRLVPPPPATTPSRRRTAMMAYDSVRQVTVLFGGSDNTGRLGDTWESDGITWTRRTPTSSPTPRASAAMMFDPVGRRMVMFGGSGQTSDLGETWEYDGTTWTKLDTVPAPGVQNRPAMAWDSGRNLAVLFSGCDTWELAGGAWTKIITTPTTAPACREGAAMAYLPSRQRVVLFGGTLSGTFELASDTWEYGATGWTRVFGGASTPDGRRDHTMTYDPSVEAVVLVGGATGGGLLDDVWHYGNDGNGNGRWSKYQPITGPSPRLAPMTYDRRTRELVMFSGIGASTDTWVFDGSRWTDVTPMASPARRYFHAIAYDPDLERVLVFGGRGIDGDLDDAWEWRDRTWTPVMATTRPPPRWGAAMAYDERSTVFVVFGGRDNTTNFADTWELAGATWTPIQANGPSAQSHAAMTYDPVNEQIVLFDTAGETWIYKDHVWSQLLVQRPPQAGHPGPRQYETLAFDRRRGTVILVGGVDRDNNYLSDVWELDLDDPDDPDDRNGHAWVKIAAGGDPLPRRYSFGGAFHDGVRGFVLFGGEGATELLADTWLLRYESATPDEICDNTLDDDGDRYIDGDDDDCK